MTLVTPEVRIRALTLMSRCIELNENNTYEDILPGVSSVATKVLSGEVVTASSSKVKVEMIRLWMEGLLAKYFKSKGAGKGSNDG